MIPSTGMVSMETVTADTFGHPEQNTLGFLGVGTLKFPEKINSDSWKLDPDRQSVQLEMYKSRLENQRHALFSQY